MKRIIIQSILLLTLPFFVYAQGEWTQKADFGGTARANAVGFSIGDKGYIGTGFDGSRLKDFWEYDPSTDIWTQKADFGGTARHLAVGFSVGNRGYIGTGSDDSGNRNDLWEYDPLFNTWTSKADFGGTARQGAVGFSIGERGYIGTGWDGTGRTDFWEYDPEDDDWVPKADFGGDGRFLAVGLSIGEKGYIGTGSVAGTETRFSDFWEYDPVEDEWSPKSDFEGTDRNWAVGFSIGTKGYVGTGLDPFRKNDFWEYDPSMDAWTQKVDFGGTARRGAVAFSIGDKGYIGTGHDGSPRNDFWEYDPVIYVTNTDDTGPGSLRQAIIDANANPGHDFIHFDIPGEDPHIIQPETPLPSITQPVTIDGFTQPGASPDTAAFVIRLDGSTAGGTGLHIGEVENSVIRGLGIGFFDVGISIAGNNNVIEGNHIRANSADGILITGSGNSIGGNTPAQRNIFFRNSTGIVIFPGSSNNTIQGNLIGMPEPDGEGLPIPEDGISISGSNNFVLMNVISGNQSNGILIQRWDEESEIPDGNIIQGNRIGTNIPGTEAIPNGQGISIGNGANTLIGGMEAEDRNIISGNTFNGIHISGTLSTGNVISGNFIGADISGFEPIPNHWGITIQNAPNNIVGGTTTMPGFRNIISGNTDNGVNILDSLATGNIVAGNFIGIDITGEIPLGNGQRGVRIEHASGNRVGGTGLNEGNIIAFNGSQGVQFIGDDAVSNAILSNSIHSNGGIGIDLGDDGVTLNEIPEQDEGPNKLRNFPVLFLAGSDIQVVMGTLQSDPESVFRIEFFSNDVCDPSGHGQGEIFLGALEGIESDSVFVMSFDGTISTGKYITATATDGGDNTSEFSKCVLAGTRVKLFGENFVVNTTLSGIPLHWPDGRARYAVSESVPEEFRAAIIAGYETWASEFEELLTLTSMGVVESDTWGGVRDGINNNVWITSNWEDSTGTHLNTIAITRVRYDAFTGAMHDVDIAYNAERFGWATDQDPDSMDVQNTATHEAGHFLGLGDIYNSGDPGYLDEMGSGNQGETMYGLIALGETHKHVLNAGDKRGIEFVYGNLPDERISLVLIFDGSDSYAVTHNAFEAAKNSAIELVDKMRIGDRIGVVKLPDDVVQPMTEINESNRSAIQSAIGGMTPDPGGPTAIGAGLETGQSLFTSVPSNYVQAMILFSDGEEDSTPSISSVVENISPTQIEIYTMGMGESTTQAKDILSFAASETGGKYYLSEDATEIVNIVNYIWNFLTGRQLLFFVLGSPDDIEDSNEVIHEGIWIQLVELFPGIWIQLVEQFPGIWIQLAMVDDGASIIQPGIFWQGSDLDLVLVEPGTLRLITPDVAAVDDKIQFFSGATYEFYVIEDPVPGEWGLGVGVKDFDDVPSEQFGLYVTAVTDINMIVSFEKERFSPSEAITVTTSLFSGGEQIFDTHVIGGAGVVDADVTAEITKPSGEQSLLPLFHTGNGVYRGTFMDTDDHGSYEFVIRAGSQDNQFTRESRHTVFVSITDILQLKISAIILSLAEVKSLIMALDDAHVRNPAAQRKNALFNKIDEVIELILNGEFQEAVDKLTHDILAKMDGHHGGNARTDWIVTEEAQDELYPKVVSIIEALEEVMLLSLQGEDVEPLAATAGDLPEKFDIFQNYPNPFNPQTTIRYQLPEDQHVTLSIYNILGQRVRTIVDEHQTAGYYTVVWDGTNQSGVLLSSGLYIYRIQAGDYTMVRKMMFVK